MKRLGKNLKNNTGGIDGVINVLKPPGMTSSSVVSVMRRLLGTKKTGHGGTLDPMAAGVLPILSGKGTRLFDYMLEGSKEYIAEICFGYETDTQDSQGKIVSECVMNVGEEDFLKASEALKGDIKQQAPMFSAVSVGGQKLYKAAYKNIEVIERPFRDATIYALELIRKTAENRFLFRLECSRGTYVRTLCHDMGKLLGGCAYMAFLLRTKSGGMDIENAYTLDELRQAYDEKSDIEKYVTRLNDALIALPVYNAKSIYWDRLRNGNSVKVGGVDTGISRVICNDVLIGMGSVENGVLKIKTMLI